MKRKNLVGTEWCSPDMHRVFCTNSYSVGKTLTIDESEAHHILKVLRLTETDFVELFDGRGNLAKAKIIEIKKRECVVEVTDLNKAPLKACVSVVFAIPKGQALDFILHRCTELGTSEFVPLITEHSLHAGSWNAERWNKVLIEVCKQCQSSYLPVLHTPIKLRDWIKVRSTERMLLFCDEEQREKKEIFMSHQQGIDILTGPEGGWSPIERDEICKAGAAPFSLGTNRLRAETATLVGLTLAKKLLGEI